MRSQRVAAVLSRRRGLIRFTPRRARALMLFDPFAFGARLPQKRVAVPRPCVTASLLPCAVVKAPVSKPDSCPESRGLYFYPESPHLSGFSLWSSTPDRRLFRSALLRRLRREAIADAAHGQQVHGVGGVVFDVTAQPDDEVVYGARVCVLAQVPDLFEYLAARDRKSVGEGKSV